MRIKLVKCKKCGTTVMTNDTLHDRLLGEKNMVLSEIKKITELEKNVKGNALKRLKVDKVANFNKLGELNRLIKQLQHQVRESERDVHEIFSKILTEELRKHGYTTEQFREFAKQADKIHEKNITSAQKEIDRIYGSLK